MNLLDSVNNEKSIVSSTKSTSKSILACDRVYQLKGVAPSKKISLSISRTHWQTRLQTATDELCTIKTVDQNKMSPLEAEISGLQGYIVTDIAIRRDLTG